MVKRPKEYVWSNYHANGWGNESWLKQHDEYKRLGRIKEERCRYLASYLNIMLMGLILNAYEKHRALANLLVTIDLSVVA